MSAKDIIVKAITAQQARDVVTRHHYSGKYVNNSSLHLGIYYAGRLEGAMQFGSPLDRRAVLPLVRDTPWNGMMELNRMAFSDALPRNSESRALGVAFRLIRKHRPDIKWIISFSDATRCGDGTIYRASGFLLTGIKPNTTMWRLPSGETFSDVGLRTSPALQRRLGFRPGKDSISSWARRSGATPIPGYQLRYIRFLDPDWRGRLTVPVIPFEKIPDDVRMYRGEKMTRRPVGGTGDHPAEGGAGPTPTLHLAPEEISSPPPPLSVCATDTE